MKKTLLVLLVVILSLGALASAGYAGYRIGYAQGAGGDAPFAFHGKIFRADSLPAYRFDGGFERGPQPGFGPGGFSRMERGRGFGFFSPLSFLLPFAVLGLIVWFGYKLFKGNGWQLSFTRQPAAAAPAKTETETKAKAVSKK